MSTDTILENRPPTTGIRDRLRGWGPLGIAAFLLVVVGIALTPPVGALVAVLWVWASKTPWRDIGYVRPKSWLGAIVIGIAFGIALKLLMKAVVMPYLGSPPTNQAFHYMVHNPQALAEFAIYAVIGAGWGEETVFRGYLFERFGKLFGTGWAAKLLIVVVTTAIFAGLHWAQGVPGITQAAIVGLLFAAIFAITGRLVMLMIAHAAFDLTAAAIVFLDVESPVAHLVFN